MLTLLQYVYVWERMLVSSRLRWLARSRYWHFVNPDTARFVLYPRQTFICCEMLELRHR